MSILLKVLNASKVADLPPVCQPFWEDDEFFADLFGCLDDATKCEYVATTMKKCLELNIRDDHNILRMFMLVIDSREEEYEDEETDTQEVVVPTVAMPTPPPAPRNDREVERLTRKLAEAQAEIETLKAQLTPAEPENPKPAKPATQEKRGRGRPPKNPNCDMKCQLCGIGFSSFGARYNHYGSKQHTDACVSLLEKVRNVVATETGTRHLKLRTVARSHLYDPELTTEDPSIIDIDAVLTYVKSKPKNPLADLMFLEGKEFKTMSGKPYISWKNVSVKE
jgi:hypothetical protein